MALKKGDDVCMGQGSDKVLRSGVVQESAQSPKR